MVARFFHNFSCITFNWNIDLICSWDELPGYRNRTEVVWKIAGHPLLPYAKCPIRYQTSCQWGLGGDGERYDVDPDRQISVCLQLRTNDDVKDQQCSDITIDNIVKPDTVSYIDAISTSPLCLNISWGHDKIVDAKIYKLELLSERENIAKNVESTENPSSGFYHHAEYYHICDLSYYTNYTISVRTRPIDYDGFPTGYWSDPRTTTKVTPKSVPSRSPPISPGAFTLAAISFKGSRTVTIYWPALPRYSWNGENLTYIIQATSAKPCKQQTLNPKLYSESSSKFEILPSCSYDILVWAKNEIGQSDIPSRMFITNEGLNPPMDVFLNTTHQSKKVEISWKHQPHATFFTVFWCQSDPGRTCSNGFYNKTVSGRYSSTFVNLKGFPALAYVFGVSAESIRNGQTISSGFQWTDCSTISSRGFRSPRITFRSLTKKRMVLVSWAYSFCNSLRIKRQQNSTEYKIKITTSSQHHLRIVNGNVTSIHLPNIAAGEEVCVSVVIRLNHSSSEHASPIKCYTQDRQGSKKHVP
ncbi:uncharacterized protein LOC132556517 [Ylistrum balloti]|uniref:uncharacterized protein LOC132556517 n=1 Tax=Ylistrum balloti TaxID=509963 RepID=UPI002905B20C|nr:uncharacterized protein LOC132556517 [Ylistrum balloti]